MKNTSKYFFAAALSILALSGCENKDNDPGIFTGKDCPEFSATIGDPKTRAFDRQWEAGDMIGISGANRINVGYLTNDGLGSFTVKTPGSQIYFQNDDETSFTAYYPWNDLTDTTLINADTRDQSGQKSFDFLWATASGKKSTPNVTFNFTHKMAKVVLTVRPGTGMSYDEIKNVSMSLTGICNIGSFNITNGTTTVAEGNGSFSFSELAAFNDTEKTMTFSLIFFPQIFNTPIEVLAVVPLPDNKSLSLKAPVDFTGANSEKDGTDAKNEWVAGRQYNLSLTLNKTELIIGGCAINPWNEVTGDDITVD